MRVHSQDKIVELVKLRKRGHSIHELMNRLQMAKTTVWHHIQGIKVLPQYEKRLRARRDGSIIRKQRAMAAAEKIAHNLLSGEQRYPSSLPAMLYWAEGNKESLVFTNTGPRMVKMFLKIMKRSLGVSEDRLMITVRYFTDMKARGCLAYWSKETGVPKHAIRMYYNDGGKRGKSPFGICRITLKKGSFILKVLRPLIRQIKPW